MKCHSTIEIDQNELENDTNFDTDSSKKNDKVVLVGNPNVGKSLFFNYFSGMYVDVSNFPGTTVSISSAKFKNYDIYDTPGIYGVSSFNDEERVAKNVIMKADRVLNIVNTLNLERDLFLTLQLIEMGLKVSVILNFSDEVKKKNLKVDSNKLSEILGVEVYETSAVNKTGFENLESAIKNARKGKLDLDLFATLQQIMNKGISQADSVLIVEGDEDVSNEHNITQGTFSQRENVYINRRNKISEIVDVVQYEDSTKGEFLNKLGHFSINPITGIPILAVVLVLIYFFVGEFVAQTVVNFTEVEIGHHLFENNLKSFVADFTPTEIKSVTTDKDGIVISNNNFDFPKGMNENESLKNEFYLVKSKPNTELDFEFHNPLVELMFGDFGFITMTVTYLVFLLLPLVIGFYLVMAILEDSGYLPRLATMLDRTFSKLGLNGRAVIPIILGFGCITMANITTRLMGTEREKTIVTAILQFAIPCSAQLAVIAAMLAGSGPIPILIYAGTIISVLVIISTVLDKLLPGESSPLLMDLPSMRIPNFKNVVKKSYYRTIGFMREAGGWFFVGSFAVGLMKVTGLLILWQNFLEPITTNWLKLPKEAANAFIMGIIRRDFGAAGLFNLSLTQMQVTVALIIITLFVPCIASVVVMLKERGWKEGVTIWVGTWIVSFLIGGIIAQIFI